VEGVRPVANAFFFLSSRHSTSVLATPSKKVSKRLDVSCREADSAGADLPAMRKLTDSLKYEKDNKK
jgi:hypothetical protein